MNGKYRIMVVDDSEENRGAVAELLRAKGYVVEEACNGREAIAKKDDFPAHLFLLDVVMPEMNGLELLEELHIKDNINEAIIMTGHENLEDAKKAMELGAFSYIGKPIRSEELHKQVNKAFAAVERKQLEQEYTNTLEEKVKSRTRELEEMLQIVQNQSQRLDTIINSMSEGLVAIDNEENIVLMNDQAQRILQMNFFECAGENINNLLKETPYGKNLIEIIRNGYSFFPGHNHLAIKNKETGRVSYFIVKVSEFRDQTGTITGKVLNFIDETAKLKFDKLRNSLLTIVSHELRTPLTILINYFSMLRTQKDNQKMFEEILVDMESTGRNLNYHINNIVAIANLSDRTLPLERYKTDIAKLIKDQIEKYKSEIAEKNVTVNVNSRLPGPYISIESNILSIAVNSLISNAIKFNNENNRVDITLSISSKDNRRSLCIDIADQGIGISREQQSNLFEDFVQLEDHMTRHYNGIGVGLFLAKRAMEIIKGKIGVSSVEGEGSTFTLEIPLIF